MVFVLLFALKIVGLTVDPTIRLFFGDSASYLHSALTGWIPPDRSFLYGFFIRWTALAAHSMMALALAQSMLGAITACLLYRILRDSFAAPQGLATALALVLALEPAQLFYERMVMAESAGTTALALMLYAGVAWLRRPHWAWPLLWALAGITAVALRMSALPIVLGFALLPPVASALFARPRPAATVLGLHLALAAIATFALHDGYKRWYGYLSDTPPDYLVDTGAFRLGLVAPMVTRDEIVRAGLPADLPDRIGPSLADPRAREAQIWLPDGLIAQIRRETKDPRVMRKLAAYALRGDPWGLMRLGWSTTTDYFDASVTASRMDDDLGTQAADADLTSKLRACCAYDVTGVESRRNPALRYFAAAKVWLIACYLSLLPLAALALAVQWRRARGAAGLVAFLACGMFLAQMLFSHIVSFRYLHPFPLVALLCIGVICCRRQLSVTLDSAAKSGPLDDVALAKASG